MSKLVRLLRDRMRMLREDAAAVAKVVEEAFRGESELDDDMIDPHLRQVFYDLQDEHILQVRRQEYTKEGRLMRGYFWSVDDQMRLDHAPPRQAPDELADLYDSVTWDRRKPPQ